MKTLRRLIYSQVLAAVAFVTLGFLALFFFFDLVDELRWIGQNGTPGYQLNHALLYVALLIPSRLYELLPITVLIGSILVMARFAQSSEFTILRTSGLDPWRALGLLMGMGLAFALLTFAVGDYVAPLADRNAQLLKARFQGRLAAGQTGAWLKEKQTGRSYAANVSTLGPDGNMLGLRVFEFDANGRLQSITQAAKGSFEKDGSWLLSAVQRSEFVGGNSSSEPVRLLRQPLSEWRWPTSLSAEMVSVALLKPERMRTIDLFQYIAHLNANGQTAQRYEVEFWKKVFYPMSCLVMLVLALPFAYLHFRAAGLTSYVFGGVLIGISFFLLNNVLGYLGTLNNWLPWLTAAAPGLVYSLFSLAAFGWLVLRR